MKPQVLFLVALSLLSCACGKTRQAERLLDDVASYIQEAPDSALAAINTIDTLDLRTNRSRAKYSLLYSMALDKNYIDTTSVSVIMPAVRYYEHHGSAADRMKSYYYLGRIYRNANDNYSAMKALTTSYDYSDKSNDNSFKCLICAQLAAIYSYNGNSSRDLYYSQKAKQYADMAQDEKNSWIMQGRIAACYANTKQWEKSDSLFTVFFNLPIIDTAYYATFKLWASQVAVKKNPSDAEKSIQLYKEAVSLGQRPNPQNLMVVAYAYELLGRSEESDRISSAVSSFLRGTKKGSVELWKYRINKHRQNYAKALSEFEYSIQTQDSVLVAVLEESFDRVQKDYYSEKVSRIAAEKHNQRIVSGIFIAIAVFFSISLFILYLRKKSIWIRQMEEAESLKNDFARLLINDNDKDLALSQLRSQYREVFREQFKVLDDLCSAFWSPKRGNKKEMIYAASSKAIELIKNDNRLEETIDQYLSGIMSKMRVDFPKYKDKDFRIIALFIIGFSGKTIASIMDISIGTVYTYKNRIKQDIVSLDSPNKGLYMEFFC